MITPSKKEFHLFQYRLYPVFYWVYFIISDKKALVLSKDSMNILITGADGFIGSRLMRYLQNNNAINSLTGIDIIHSPWNKDLPISNCDLADDNAINSILETRRPETIVLNGALKGLELCQKETYTAGLVNVFSLKPFVLYALQNPSVHLIFISSDMTFGNCPATSFTEDTLPKAANAYGQMKVIGEEIVKLTSRWAIVRTALVYGSLLPEERKSLLPTLEQDTIDNQSLLIHWCSERTLNGKPVALADNVFCTPTYINDLVLGLTKIISNVKTGIFHCSGSDRISRYDLGVLAASMRGNPNLVQRFSSERTAIRPLDVSLNNQKTNQELGIEPVSLADGIRMALSYEDN